MHSIWENIGMLLTPYVPRPPGSQISLFTLSNIQTTQHRYLPGRWRRHWSRAPPRAGPPCRVAGCCEHHEPPRVSCEGAGVPGHEPAVPGLGVGARTTHSHAPYMPALTAAGWTLQTNIWQNKIHIEEVFCGKLELGKKESKLSRYYLSLREVKWKGGRGRPPTPLKIPWNTWEWLETLERCYHPHS